MCLACRAGLVTSSCSNAGRWARGEPARRRHGAGPGAPRRRSASVSTAAILRRPARPPRHRLRVRRAGLLHAVLLGARGGRGQARVEMQRALGLDVRWVDPDELDDLNPALARGRTRRVLRARRRLHRPAPQRAGLHDGALHLRRARARGCGVHRAGPDGGPGDGSAHQRRGDRHQPGRAHGGPDAGRGRTRRRRPHPGRRRPAPGGHRAPPRPGRRPAADGVRRGVRHLLAARGGRGAVGHEQPRRGRARPPSSTGATTKVRSHGGTLP